MQFFGKLAGFATISSAILTAPMAFAATQAGIAAGVSGSVAVSEGDREGKQSVVSGMDMLLGDKLESAEASRMQILLLDETVFTVGPNSQLVIDEFIYDPNTDTGKLTANFTRGVLRYVSGKVASANPTNVTIKTRTATIGVRGTALFAVDDPEATEDQTFVGLLGPGANNDGNLRAGGMTVSNDFGSTDVLRAGFGTFVTPGMAPGPAIPTPPRITQVMQARLTGPVARGQNGGGNQAGNQNQGGGQNQGSGQNQGGNQANNAGPQGGQQADGGGAPPRAGNLSGQRTAQTGVRARNVNVPLRNVQNIGDLANRATEEGAGRVDTENPQAAVEDMVEIAQDLGFGSLPFGVNLPLAVEVTWSTIRDLDLHLTGPNPGNDGRFHVFFGNRGNFDGSPFAQLDADRTGFGGSEVIGISQLNSGDVYRASVFNFGDQGTNSTSLSNDANARMRLIQNGQISRGTAGSTVVNGSVLANITPPTGQSGNTWVGLEFQQGLSNITTVNQFVNSSGSSNVQ